MVGVALSVAVLDLTGSVADLETTLQAHLPPRLLARIVAYDWLASLVFQPVGYAVAG
jgi:hypothetical protein